MTKEQLQELGLDEEQIKGVFKLNGLAVEKVKADLEELKLKLEVKDSKLESLTKSLDEANTQINEFGDIDELKEKVEKYKAKYTKTKEELESELRTVKLTHRIESKLSEYNPHSKEDIINMIDIEKVQLTDDGLLGLKEQVDLIKESKPYLFKEVKPKGNDPIESKNSGKLDLNNLSYDEMLELAEKGLL